MKRRILAALIAALFVLLSVCSSLPAFAETDRPAERYATPAGYSDNDYQKLVAFLETRDYDGIKNGYKLNDEYDPRDPTTWGCIGWINNDEGEKCVYWISADCCDLYGVLDASGFSNMWYLDCSDNWLDEVYVSGCTALQEFYCDYNFLSEIDISECPELAFFGCAGNFITALDLTHNPLIGFDILCAEEGGYIGITGNGFDDEEADDALYAVANGYNEYYCEGWYNDEGELITDDYYLCEYDPGVTYVCTARFTTEEEYYETPEGYNDNDYQKLVSFFEQRDWDYTRNGWKLHSGYEDEMVYDPTDPETWAVYEDGEQTGGVFWEEIDGEKRVTKLYLANGSDLDDSMVGYLDLSYCEALEDVRAYNNYLYCIDLTGVPGFYFDLIMAEGDGYVGVGFSWSAGKRYETAFAYGCFEGWYTLDDEPIESELGEWLLAEEAGVTEVVARFMDFDDLPYNEEDVDELRAFFETEDAEGVKIGERLNEDYDPYDPETWTVQVWYYDEEYDEEWCDIIGVIWAEEDGEKVAAELWLYELGITGDIVIPGCHFSDINVSYNMLTGLDVSRCTELNWLYCWYNEIEELDLTSNINLFEVECGGNRISELDVSGLEELCIIGCSDNMLTELALNGKENLWFLDCSNNMLTELDLSGVPYLEYLTCIGNELEELDLSGKEYLSEVYCDNNRLTELDVSCLPQLGVLFCSGNLLTELDVSACPDLYQLYCYGNMLTEIDLSANDNFAFDSITADGPGYVGFYGTDDYDGSIVNVAYAAPAEGAVFLGWYSEDGEYISDDESIFYEDTGCTAVVARFSTGETVMGDVDGDGSVTTADALLALRHALGVIVLDDAQVAVSDVNGDGSVDTIDALVIMRIALGITQL